MIARAACLNRVGNVCRPKASQYHRTTRGRYKRTLRKFGTGDYNNKFTRGYQKTLPYLSRVVNLMLCEDSESPRHCTRVSFCSSCSPPAPARPTTPKEITAVTSVSSHDIESTNHRCRYTGGCCRKHRCNLRGDFPPTVTGVGVGSPRRPPRPVQQLSAFSLS